MSQERSPEDSEDGISRSGDRTAGRDAVHGTDTGENAGADTAPETVDGDADPDSGAEPEAALDIEADADVEPDAEAGTDRGTAVEADADADGDADADADKDIARDADSAGEAPAEEGDGGETREDAEAAKAAETGETGEDAARAGGETPEAGEGAAVVAPGNAGSPGAYGHEDQAGGGRFLGIRGLSRDRVRTYVATAGADAGIGWVRDRWWTRQMVLSVSALAAVAALTLALVVHSPSAKAGSGTAAKTTGPAAPAALPSTSPSPSPSPTTPPPTTPPTAPPTTPPTTTPATTPAPSPVSSHDAAVALAHAVAGIPGSGTGTFSVGVADLDGTTSATYDSDQADFAYDTASIVKVDILAALMLRHQHAGTPLTSAQRGLATSMIEVSDNDAAEALWQTIGRASGLASANKALGLHHTVGGSGDLWGLTQTTASDQLALLRAVFGGTGSPLTASSRAYMKSLMTSISAGQRWGVSAADSDAAGYALKNGWLQRTATGLWDINSVGMVTYGGHRLLICVLTSGQHTEAKGISLVEAAASAAAKSFAAGLA